LEGPLTNYFSEISLSNTVATVSRAPTNTNQFILSYTTANGIRQGFYEDLIFSVRYNLSNTAEIPVVTHVWLEKIGPDGTNVNGLKTFSQDPLQTVLFITNANWGVVRGEVFPSNRQVMVKIYLPGTSSVVRDIDDNILSGISRVPEGTYVLRKIPDGEYDIEFSAPYYRSLRYRTNIQANVITEIPKMAMRNAPLIGGEDDSQVVECYEDTNTYIVFPGQSVGKEFSVDITRWWLTAEQRRNTTENKTVKSPVTTENMYGYRFQLSTRDDKPMDGSLVKRDAVLYLAYDPADVALRGWNENELAIYYWDDNGLNPRWVRVGGEVNTTAKQVVAKVSYVHSIYAVLGKAGEGRQGLITGVTLRPRVFTPSRSGDGYYGSVRVTMEFREAVERYEVKIFDLKGNLIKRFVREDGPYVQGEIAWDGKDTEGYDVKNGVYIYKIYAGGETYSGTLVIAR
ncbi:MAG: FlgD immunoglobulin-like domain containing protein, partial [Brevinematales bacterium]